MFLIYCKQLFRPGSFSFYGSTKPGAQTLYTVRQGRDFKIDSVQPSRGSLNKSIRSATNPGTLAGFPGVRCLVVILELLLAPLSDRSIPPGKTIPTILEQTFPLHYTMSKNLMSLW